MTNGFVKWIKKFLLLLACPAFVYLSGNYYTYYDETFQELYNSSRKKPFQENN